MSFTSGFFNALDHDRRYNALTVSSMFDGVMNDGVFSTIGDCFIVKPLTGTDLRITVGTGRAWFYHTWSLNDSLFVLTLANSNPLLPRTDAVVLEVNHEESVRANSLKIVQGTPANNPTRPVLTNTDYIKQYPLAYITVPAGATAITQSAITNMVGSSECPFANAILSHITTDQLILQWRAQFEEWMANNTGDFDSWKYMMQSNYEQWSLEQTDQFLQWFMYIRDNLTSDAAGDLEAQIVNLAFSMDVQLIGGSNWVGDAPPYKQTVLSGIVRAGSTPVLYSKIEPTFTEAEQKAYLKAYAMVAQGYAETTDGSIIFYAWKKPENTITVRLRGL